MLYVCPCRRQRPSVQGDPPVPVPGAGHAALPLPQPAVPRRQGDQPQRLHQPDWIRQEYYCTILVLFDSVDN